MAKKFNARRWAQAAFEIALERNELDRWLSDLSTVSCLSTDVSTDIRIVALLENPKISSEIKDKLFAEQFGDVSPLVLNLVQLLVTRRSLRMVSAIADEYERLLFQHRGIERAVVTTAVSLTEEEKQELAQRLNTMTGKKVILQSEVNPRLIGGIVIKIGWKLLDGSMHSKLQALRKQMAGQTA
ncbi:MAG: ATP synthase F1 subunit delta [Chloroflexi bacterium]|nr:ATP synthase F1 subunit delta [Chloroflexota bacterium]